MEALSSWDPLMTVGDSSDVHWYSASVPISVSMLAEMGWPAYAYLLPDRNRFPTFVPFPRIDRAQRKIAFARERIADAYDVLRNGLPEYDYD